MLKLQVLKAPRKVQRCEPKETNIVPIECDPTDRKPVWKYPVNERCKEKEMAKEFSSESIINDFNAKKKRRAQLF